MTVPSQPLFLFGAGYTARALAAIWDGPVIAVQRPKPGRIWGEQGGMTVISTQDPAAIKAAVPQAHLLISAPPSEEGCPAVPILRDVAREFARVTYLSTTGVYGDLGGGWAFEWSDTNPQSDRAERRVVAEQAWLALRPDARLVRLPGIYGPGRSAFDRLRKGRARRIIKPGQVFSRVHVADIASGLKALAQGNSEGVFHLCDDQAAPPQDVIAYAANLLNLPVPPDQDFDTAELSDMARSFYAECKRVSNARIKAATGWRPQYPTYREGLNAILAAGEPA